MKLKMWLVNLKKYFACTDPGILTRVLLFSLVRRCIQTSYLILFSGRCHCLLFRNKQNEVILRYPDMVAWEKFISWLLKKKTLKMTRTPSESPRRVLWRQHAWKNTVVLSNNIPWSSSPPSPKKKCPESPSPKFSTWGDLPAPQFSNPSVTSGVVMSALWCHNTLLSDLEGESVCFS